MTKQIVNLLVGMALAIPTVAFAQMDTLWTSKIDSAGNNAHIIRTADGGFAVGTYGPSRSFARTYAFEVIKLDSLGRLEWMSQLHDTLNGSPIRGVTGWTIAQTHDQGFVIGGQAAGVGAVMARTDANGDSLWLRGYPFAEFNWEGGYMRCCVAADSNVVVATSANIVKISIVNGDILWRFGTRYRVGNIVRTGDRGFVAAGYTGAWTHDYAVKVDNDGNLVWENVYAARETEFCTNLTVCAAGGFCLLSSARFGNEGPDLYPRLVKIDENGEVLWQRAVSELDTGSGAADLVETADGGFTITGRDWRRYPHLIRTNGRGEPLWHVSYGEWDPVPWPGSPSSLFRMEDNGYVIAGFSNDVGLFLIRTEPDTTWIPFELISLQGNVLFGQLEIDSIRLDTIEIVNSGDRYAVIDSVSFEGDSSVFTFNIDLPLRIDPSDTLYIPVGFRPSADTTYSATLAFFYGDNQSVEVALTGRGFAPNEVFDKRDAYPTRFGLSSAFPNPFNSTTTIRFSTSEDAYPTRLAINDLQGRQVATLIDGKVVAGSHVAIWKAENVPTGIYIARLESAGASRTLRAILVK